MPYPFDWTAQRWGTVSEFSAYLSGIKVPTWFNRIVIHHTWKPVQVDWRGMQSMAVLERYYRDVVEWRDASGVIRRGWSSGPNMFVCLGSPSPEWDGIYQGTPIGHQGTHAGKCNSSSIGIEVVGNFDLTPWSGDLHVLMLDICVAICRWAGRTAKIIVGHRDCGSPKTCPGSAIDLVSFRGQVDAILITNGIWDLWGKEYPLPPEQRIYGIPQAWLTNMRSATTLKLGKAESFPVYDHTLDDFCVQLFERGAIRYYKGQAVIVPYIEIARFN